MSEPSELRRDPAGGPWVIIAPRRAERPDEFAAREAAAGGLPMESCPFCPGHEGATPPETAAVREAGSVPDGPGWSVRVVPNKYPAVGTVAEPPPAAFDGGLFEVRPGAGAHEVVIETPDHNLDFSRLTSAVAGAVVRTWRDRIRALERDPGCAYVQLFKNHGRNAGASLSHPHSQIVALPVVPVRIAEEIEAAVLFRAAHGVCLHCRILEEETADGRRVILDEGGFLATAPFASRFPYEIRLQPRRHADRFVDLDDEETAALADRLRAVLGRLRRSLDDPPFNLLLHQSPPSGRGGRPDEEIAPAYHWHIEILPVLSRVAGFEWGTGIHINTVAPETAAARLRREEA
jgi:UDPglucose--hexose-1-phosphate uridylyltransferase